MNDHHTIEERVSNLERGLAVIVATKGTLRLCTSHLALVWMILAALAGVGTMVLQTAWSQQQQGAATWVSSLVAMAMIAAPGHAVSLERLSQMQQTLNEVKAILEKIAR
jgi:uncharacterized membrane protein